MSVLGVILVRIFPHSDWIRRDTEHPSVFSLNAGNYGPEQLRIRTLFTRLLFHQWLEWGKSKEIIRSRKLSTNTEMIYPLPEMPSKNSHGEKDDGKLLRSIVNLILWQKHEKFVTWMRIHINIYAYIYTY